VEELVIPLRISGDEALKVLDQLKDKGRVAGTEIKKGADDATEAHESLTMAMLKAGAASQLMAAGKQMLDMFTQSAIESGRELQKMAQEFINLRDRARELAGVLGRPGNIEFTKEQIGFAAETGFADAGKAVDFRTAFQGEANQYMGRFKDANEFAQFEKEAARLGNQNNVPADVMAKIAGMVIRTGPKEGQTSESQMQRLGGAFKTMMAGSGSINELAGQLGRMSGLVGEGKAFPTVEEAAVSTRMAAETNLPEAYTSATEIRTGVIELSTDEKKAQKAKELGITPETTNFQAIKSLSEAQKTSGENMDVFLSKIFPMKRVRDAYRDAIEAYRNGVMTQGLKDAAKVLPGQIEAETSVFFADPTQGGMLAMEEAKGKVKEAELGEDKATIAPYMRRAKTELAEYETSPMNKFLAKATDWFSGGTRAIQGQEYTGFEQIETKRALDIIRKEAQQEGVDTSGVDIDIVKDPQRGVERQMAELVRLTVEANESRRKANEKPLVVKPGNDVGAGGARQ
jgi:hypothetical protein